MTTLFQVMFNPVALSAILKDCKVTRYGYRRAAPSFPRLGDGVGYRPKNYDRGEPWQDCQRELAIAAGYRGTDNHETYLIEYAGEKVAIMFSDWAVWHGADVVVGDW